MLFPFKPVYKLALSVILYFLITPATAQVWQMLGTREQDQTSYAFATSPIVKFSPNGTPYIAYQEDYNHNKVIVKKLVNNKWEVVGNEDVSEDYSFNINLVFAPDGTPFVSYKCSSPTISLLNVKKLVGDKWVSLGKVGLGSDAFNSFLIAPDGTPYISFSSTAFLGGCTVRKWEKGKWLAVGSMGTYGISEGVALYSKLLMYNNELYVAYSDSSKEKKCTVKKFINNNWTTVGNVGFSSGEIIDLDFAIDGKGALYVSYQDIGKGAAITVKKFDGTNWVDVGTAGFSVGIASTTNIGFLADNTPVVFYNDKKDSYSKAVYSTFTGGKWVNTDVSNTSSLAVECRTSMTVNQSGTPYITYLEPTLNYKFSVKKLVDNKWEGVGINGISPEGVAYFKLRADDLGVPYVAYSDMGNQNKVSVRKFTNNNWQNIGNESFTSANIWDLDFALSNNQIPYVVYRDPSTGGNFRVKKFNGTNWMDVGATKPTDQSYYSKIEVAKDGTPYVAYGGNGGNFLTVRKFDGTNWVTVGDPYYLTQGLSEISFVISEKGDLYTAFISNKVVQVRKFNNGNWENLAGVAVATNANSICLGVDAKETPYISYYDYNKSSALVVKKFSAGNWLEVGTFSVSGKNSTSLTFTADGAPLVAYHNSLNGDKLGVFKFENDQWNVLGAGSLTISQSKFASLYAKNGYVFVGFAVPQALAAMLVSGADLPPQIYSFTPNYTVEGSKVTITGDNFNNTSEVKFGATLAKSFKIVSPKEIIAEVPSGSSGSIQVTTPKGMAAKEDFVFRSPPPVINSLNPSRALQGATITISGQNFSSQKEENIVYFGPVKATVIAATPTSLSVSIPAYSAFNQVAVTVKNLTGYSLFPFMVKPPQAAEAINAKTFGVKQDFSTDKNPYQIYLGDLDEDGKPEVIIGNSSSQSLSIYPNQCTGDAISFGTKIDIPTFASQEAITVSDIDADGKLDLIVKSVNGNFTFFRNTGGNGKISFDSGTAYNNIAAANVAAFAASDLDNDGRTDIVAANQSEQTLSVFRNVFYDENYLYLENKVDYTDPFALKVEINDLDGDGFPEIVTGSQNANYVFPNTSSIGKLSFGTGIRLLSSDSYFTQTRVTDIDGDGKPDILMGIGNSKNLGVFRNLSSPSNLNFDKRLDFPINSVAESIEIGDFDGDGLTDIAVSNFKQNTVSVIKNNSKPGNVALGNLVDFPVGIGPKNMVAGDINGDGFTDLLVVNLLDNTFSVLKNTSADKILPADNFRISVSSASCKGSSSGTIVLKAQTEMDYQAEITIEGTKKRFDFKKELTIENLKAGTYVLSVFYENKPGTARNYTLTVSEPQDLAVYSFVDQKTNSVKLNLSGGTVYHIDLNNRIYSTGNNEITLPLTNGINKLSVSTDLICQGIIEKKISSGTDLNFYPNPFDRFLNIGLNKSSAQSVSITIYNTVGATVFKQNYTNVEGGLEIDLSKLSPGMYLIKMNADGTILQHKVIKK